LLAQGKDPMANKADMMPEGAAKFLSVAQRWHENRESSLDAAHSQRVWSRLERDVFPALGSKMMHEITPPDVLEMIRKIEARGALDISRRAKQGVGQRRSPSSEASSTARSDLSLLVGRPLGSIGTRLRAASRKSSGIRRACLCPQTRRTRS
jgi:integrase